MNLGPMEIGVLLLVLLFIFGPKKIPELGKSLGEGIAGFRKATAEANKPVVLIKDDSPIRSEVVESKPVVEPVS